MIGDYGKGIVFFRFESFYPARRVGTKRSPCRGEEFGDHDLLAGARRTDPGKTEKKCEDPESRVHSNPPFELRITNYE